MAIILKNQALLRASCVVWVAATAACLSDDDSRERYSSYVWPADRVVPSLDEDEAARKKLDANDGFDTSEEIALRGGAAEGRAVTYWDFGELTAATLRPMYIFRAHDPADAGAESAVTAGASAAGGQGATTPSTSPSLDDAAQVHPDLIDAIPGDSAYSPLLQLYVVYVTNRYKGERITSIRALEDAAELGLVESALPLSVYKNCVVTLGSVSLQVSASGATRPPRQVYYRGQSVFQHCADGPSGRNVFNTREPDGSVRVGNVYVLRLVTDNQPLEALGRDTNADGIPDTEVVFDGSVSATDYSGIWNKFDVAVPVTYQSGTLTDEPQLFVRNGNALSSQSSVAEYADTGVLLNRPIQGVR